MAKKNCNQKLTGELIEEGRVCDIDDNNENSQTIKEILYEYYEEYIKVRTYLWFILMALLFILVLIVTKYYV